MSLSSILLFFSQALNRNVEKYEETYGVIEVGKGDIEPDFSGPVN
jgi:hypothetical protein